MSLSQMDTDRAGLINDIESTPALEYFEENAGGEELFFRTAAHEIILSGGNSSGKSLCGIVRGCYHTIPEKDKYGKMTGKTIHPYLDIRIPTAGVEGWISTWSQDTQRDTLRTLMEKYMKPYFSRPPDVSDGVYKRLYFEGNSWVNMKWQTQGVEAYRGPKKNWIFMDEPHKEMIYKETRARLFRSGGYMWTCMTPIVDMNDPLKSQDVIWMRDEIVEPWERDPDKFPLRHVIYMDVSENSRYVDIDFIEKTLAGMSSVEQAIRRSGSFLMFTGRHCFDQAIVMKLRTYLIEHPEESEPQYGHLEYDSAEGDDWKVKFIRDKREYFPDNPSGEYVLKIWEEPVPEDGLQLSPGYTITVDVAEGKPGGDYTSVYVFRDDNRRIVAGLHGHISEEVLARELWLLGNYYNDTGPNYRPALMVIEVRTYGAATQKYLLVGNTELNIPKYPGDRFYYRPTPADLAMGKKYAYAPGWDTNSATRKFVVTGMREMLMRAYASIAKGNKCTIPDIGCIKEATGFVQNKKGRFEGNPDDRLFCLGIANNVLDKPHNPMILSSQEPELTDGDHTWIMEKSEDSGIYQVRFNIEGIMSKVMKEKPDLRF